MNDTGLAKKHPTNAI